MSENKNEELPKSVIGFLDKYGAKLWDGVKSTYGKAKEESVLNWRLGYETYLDNVFQKYSYAKPFLSGNYPRLLSDFYVPLSVSCGDDFIEQVSIEDLTLTNKFSIIVANAGSGKTMLMRHLFVDTIDNKKVSHLPVFIELRELNNVDLTLYDLIKKRLRDNGFNFDDNYIEKAFEAGHFAIYLDGFDEISYEKRAKTNQQIQELADRFNKNYFVLSSRPDDSLNRWTLFDVWQVEPLNIEQACKLVEKTNEDKDLKEKFLKALKEELFKRHKSFLANPLLLSIMLFTYKDIAEIPQKLSTFYEQAYISLFSRHDAEKGGFSREKRSKLDIQDFRKLFSAFCFLTYRKNRFGDFSEVEMIEFLDKASKVSGIQVDKNCYLEDAIQAICLLVRDGLNITFSHRSFQEYFAAVFIEQITDSEKRNAVLFSILSQKQFGFSRNFWIQLLQISVDVYEKLVLYIIPKLEQAYDYIDGEISKQIHFEILSSLYGNISIEIEKEKKLISSTIKSNDSSSLIDVCSLLVRDSRAFNHRKKEFDKFFSFVTTTYGIEVEINIEEFFKTQEIYNIFNNGIYSKSSYFFQDIFNLKKQLIEKHKKQEELLYEDLI